MRNREKRLALKRISGILSSLSSTVFWIMLIFGFEEISMAAASIVAIGVHEMGHLLYLKFLGVDAGIRGVLSGFRIQSGNTLSYSEERRLYLFGPLANIILALILSLLTPLTNGLLLEGVVVNLITALSNLLPVEGYDGYGALISLLRQYEMERGEVILHYVSFSIIFLMCIFSLYFIDRFGGGYWIFAIFLASMLKHLSKKLARVKIENSGDL